MSIRIRFELLLLLAAMSGTARAEDDPMEPYRDRFKLGYEKFTQGALGEALQYWEPIYRELGPEKGYVVSYDIALVFDALGDSTRAAERYESFLGQVDARRARGEALDEPIRKDEEKARQNLAALVSSRGRIRVPPAVPAETVQIDHTEPRLAGFVAYVVPGRHAIVFAPGTQAEERREIEIAGGELVVVERSPRPPPPPPPKPVITRELETTTRPYSAAWMIALGAAAAGSAVIPIALYASAQGEYDRIRKQQLADAELPLSERTPYEDQLDAINGYYRTRAAAYATVAIPLVLAAGAIAVTLGWSLGGKRSIQIVPQTSGALVLGRF